MLKQLERFRRWYLKEHRTGGGMAMNILFILFIFCILFILWIIIAAGSWIPIIFLFNLFIVCWLFFTWIFSGKEEEN